MEATRNFEEELQHSPELFSSPIQTIQLSTKKPSHHSPTQITLQFPQSGSFKKILEKLNEEESENDTEEQLKTNNTIGEFKTFEESPDSLKPIMEDKENEAPSNVQLVTPLKNKELRSPLKDITPTLTKKKKKSALKAVNEKYCYLTPRTMADSRFSRSSGLRRLERL
jgi:hypothetical protein